MSATTSVRVGNKGRVVLPSGLRERQGWHEGTILVAVERADGVTLLSMDDALAITRRELSGGDPVADLLAERRAAAQAEDATT